MMVLAPGIRFADLRFRHTPSVIATVVLEGSGRIALIDPGPTSTLATLREELGRGGRSIADVEAVLLTHIHLDHAGATGTLVAENPRIRVYVHAVGAPHLIDPTKLLNSATRLYGHQMDELWGPFLPVPVEQITPLGGGEAIEVVGRALSVAATPGHASHHVSYFDSASRLAFVGDVGGVRVPPGSFVLPPTPPPDIDLDAWQESVDRILAWHPDALFLTHFGLVSTPIPHLQQLITRLGAYVDLAKSCLSSGADEDAQRERFIREMSLDVRRAIGEENAARYMLAVPPDQCWQGLARYWKKRMGA
jgi:glyoxylase-like metal-dependent hydrolase (beta-lactamase superfamily II)